MHPKATRPLPLLLALAIVAGASTLLAPAAAAQTGSTDLLISEYIEGSSFNKAVELYNGTGAAIDLGLGGYRLEIYFNGNSSAGTNLSLTGVVASGDVFVIADDGADGAILAVTDQTSGSNFFNGDDAVVVRKGGAAGPVVDSIGQVGFDPGSQWGSGAVSTQDNTLVRKAAVCTADTDPSDAYDPAPVFDGFPQNSFGDLGMHTAMCGDDPPPPPADGWVINEIHADPDGGLAGDANGDGDRDGSEDELVEIYNGTGADADISGWAIYDGFGPRHVFPAGTVVADGCGIVVFGGGAPTGSFGGMRVQTASTGFLGFNNGGDSVTLDDGVMAVASASYGSEGGQNQSLTRDPDVTGSFVLHTAASGTLFSPGTRVDGTPFDGCDFVEMPMLEIYEIQGAGFASPYVGQRVETLDNVVTATAPDGFFIQTPDSRADADADTSNGVFVFTGPTGPAPGLSVGDRVDVVATVVEFFDFTELSSPDVTFLSGGEPPPAAVTLDDMTPSPDPPQDAVEYERLEGMRVSLGSGAVSGPNQSFGSDPLAEVHIVADGTRAFREPGIEYPGLPGLPVWDGNPEVFELDPDKLGLPPLAIPAGSTFSAEGVIGYEFGGYELWPSALTVNEATLPVPVRPRAGLEATIGSLNVFRLFDDVDDPGSEDNGQVVSTVEYSTRLEKLTRYVLNVLRAPDVLAVQEAEKLDVLDDLATVISLADPTVVYTAYLVEGNDVGGIDTGYLVREDRFRVDAVTQLAAGETLSVDGSLLHDRPPLLLEGAWIVSGAELPLRVLALHQRSLSGIETSSRVRQKRLEQAQSVATIVQDLQTTTPGVGLTVVGDYNAFEFTDGYVDVVGQIAGDFDPADNLLSGADLVNPDLTILTETVVPAAQRYSFIFRGSAQAIDHALASAALQPLVAGVEYGRANADAPFLFIEDPATPLRSSDHDGLVLYVDADPDDDGVPIGPDVCAGTAIPEAVPTQGLKPNHYALVDGDTTFDTVTMGNGGGGSVYTTTDTGGCSCEQILTALAAGQGQYKFGCTAETLDGWIGMLP